MPLHLATPLVESAFLRVGARRVWLKLESLQPSGSFKLRGIGHACEHHARSGARRFLSSSGGNAGMAVAYAGRELGVPVVVVVPETASERAKSIIAGYGAEVVVHGASWSEANDHLMSLREPSDAFLHPFDDPLVWEGHATMIAEVAASGFVPDAVVLSVGGGGLLCGVLEGMHAAGWQRVPVIAAETEGAASLRAAIEADELVTLDAITSLATSLGARRVCARALEWTRRHPIVPVTVTDAAAVQACFEIADAHRIIVEPACGASIAALGQHELTGNVLVILCGGATVGYPELEQMRAVAH